jgi:hypothetical protein
MTDEPRRLLDDPNTDAMLRRALQAGRDELPSEQQIDALAARLGPLLGPGGGGGGGGGASIAVKAIGALAAASLAGAIVWWSAREPPRASHPHRAQTIARSVAQREAPEVVPSGLDVPSDLEAPQERPHPRAATPAPTPPSELDLVQRAQAALRTSPTQALSLADEHRRLFRDGMLAQEREVIAIDALVRLARSDEARARADAFRHRWPSSAHARRIDVLVGSQ